MGSKHNPPRWWRDYEEECRVYNFLSSVYALQVFSGQVVFNPAAAAKLQFMPIADPPGYRKPSTEIVKEFLGGWPLEVLRSPREEAIERHAEIEALRAIPDNELLAATDAQIRDLETSIQDELDQRFMWHVERAVRAYQQHPTPLTEHPTPLTEQEKIDQDVYLLGVGFGQLQPDGTIKHLPATKILVYPRGLITLKVKI